MSFLVFYGLRDTMFLAHYLTHIVEMCMHNSFKATQRGTLKTTPVSNFILQESSNKSGGFLSRQYSYSSFFSESAVFLTVAHWAHYVRENGTFSIPQSSQIETGHWLQDIMANVKTAWFTCSGQRVAFAIWRGSAQLVTIQPWYFFYFLDLIFHPGWQ